MDITPVSTLPEEESTIYRMVGVIKVGILKGQLVIPTDFDDPLPDDLLDLFEGKGKPPYPDANF